MLHVRQESEFCAFLDLMRCLGIEVQQVHQLEKDPWQELITSQGYNLTSYACSAFKVGSIFFVFANGQPHWTVEVVAGSVVENSHGPESAFLFAYDEAKKEVISRHHINWGDGHRVGQTTGLAAMFSQYNIFPIPKSQPIPAKLVVGNEVYSVTFDSDARLIIAADSFKQAAADADWKLIVPPYDVELDKESGVGFAA